LLKNKYDDDIYDFFKTNYVAEDMIDQFNKEFPNWESFRVKLENKNQPKHETQEDEDDEDIDADETDKDVDWWTLLELN